MLPTFEGFVNCEEFFFVHIVVEFRSGKSLGVESNGVQLAIRSCDRKDGGKCIVRGIGLDCDLSVQNPMSKDQSCGESLFKCSKAEWHSSEKCQVLPFSVRGVSGTVISEYS